jgi:type I restriction enzyme R subunit
LATCGTRYNRRKEKLMTNNEAFSRVVIDALLADQGWNTQDTKSVRYEVVLGAGQAMAICLGGASRAGIYACAFSVFSCEAGARQALFRHLRIHAQHFTGQAH